MSVFQICFLFTGISFCLAFAVLSKKHFVQLSLRFFLLFLLLEALGFSFEWLLIHPSTPFKAAWLGCLMASSFLMAPCVWLFAREIHWNCPPPLWPVAWGQVALVALGFLLCVPLFVEAHEGTLLMDPSRPRTSLSLVIHITMVIAIVLYLVQVPWYLLRSLRLFQERVRINRFLFSTADEPALNALRVMIWVMATSWLLNLARMLQVMLFDPSDVWNLFATGCEVGVTLAALYAIFERCWRYNLDDQKMIQTVATGENVEKGQAAQKYTKSPLTEDTRLRIRKKILSQFEEHKLHEKSGLKLSDICDATGERAHYISQVINQDLQMSFFELVNHYRIDEAKKKIVNETETSILDIALAVGFNSKSTFNKVFKELTGVTPSTYRVQAASR